MYKVGAWAIVDDKGILINTIKPNRRSSIVCWLIHCGIPVVAATTDETVEQAWNLVSSGMDIGVTCQKVEITLAKD